MGQNKEQHKKCKEDKILALLSAFTVEEIRDLKWLGFLSAYVTSWLSQMLDTWKKNPENFSSISRI